MSRPGALAAIAGIHEFPDRVAGGLSALQLKAECARAALEDAGLTWADVDAVYDSSEVGVSLGLIIGEYFGITPRVLDTTSVGGSSFEFQAAHAARDLAAGRARVAVLTYGSVAHSEARAIGTRGRVPPVPLPGANMEIPYGLTLISNYALVAQRHMAEYGTKPEQLAEIAATTRAHALRNPDAVRGMAEMGRGEMTELTVDDVLSSRVIADPLHKLECCIISDGAGAAVLVAPDVVPDIRTTPVWVLGSGEAVGYPGNGVDITTSAAARSGRDAFGQAGIAPAEVDIAMMYDSFTITVLVALEDLGFVPKGEGGEFVAGGQLRFDHPGGPALNTDGGGLSSNHPGMRGIFLLIEATRQLRGQSTSQVEGARLAVAHGNGGQLGTRHAAGTIVLGTE